MAEHIKTLIKEYIEKNKNKTKQLENIQKILKKEVNKEVIQQTQVEITAEEEITFFMESSSAAYQIKLKKGKIKEKLTKENLPAKKIKIEVR